jgi:hypothetical protein
MTSDTTPEDEFRGYCERLTEAQLEELIVSKLGPPHECRQGGGPSGR